MNTSPSFKARVLGHPVGNGSIEARRVTAYVPETGALYALLSPPEQLSLIADLYDLEPGLAAERMELLFEVFDITEVADHRIDTLSRGQKQKVVLASALIHDPQVILLDEPLTGLDVTAARTVKNILQGLVRRGRTVVFSSHILDVVERTCDRAIIINRGEIVADAPTCELVGRCSLFPRSTAHGPKPSTCSMNRQLVLDRIENVGKVVNRA